MVEDKEDNIYNLEEEEDNTPLNFAISDPESDETESKLVSATGHLSPFRLLLEIMFNPMEGWKKLRRDKIDLSSLQSGCFYPLLALLAVSYFSDFFYSVNVSLSSVITRAVVSFVSFFFGYYAIILVIKLLLPNNIGQYFNESFGQNYIVVSLSTLVLFSILREILPMLWPILIFLPLWTIYIMYKGSKFFKLQENQVLKSVVIIFGTVIGMPLIIDWLLNKLLPY